MLVTDARVDRRSLIAGLFYGIQGLFAECGLSEGRLASSASAQLRCV
jgi:hypothetical protein